MKERKESSISGNKKKKITSRADNYSEWYLDAVKAADLAEYAPVKGCMIFKPYGYAIWEKAKAVLDEKFKALGVENAYFPLLIPEKLLKKEKEHLEGFSPEVAVVTHAGGRKLKEPLIVRPTSETIMYQAFSKWVKSHRDLPLLINQWANIVRWEMRPRLFLRTTEFLWQEGHTVHATEEEAEKMARLILNIYKKFGEEYMAIPLIAGFKSEAEKFAGALRTYTLEAMMQDGKALQFATSHNLGQNFAKVFNIKFTDEKGTLKHPWQTSWGMSTRTIGALVMVHGDDKGLVLPPKIAPIQVVIVPIWYGDKEKAVIHGKAREIVQLLKDKGIGDVKFDDRDLHAGEKYYYWEERGVPVRIELGPRDLAKNSAVLVRRDTGEKINVALDELPDKITDLMEKIQRHLYEKAVRFRERKIKKVDNWSEFKKEIRQNNFVLAHWDGTKETEAKIKEETKASVRCISEDYGEENGKCVYSGRPSKRRVIFARAY